MSDAWHEWRAGGWGASDIAAAWTGRYGGAYKVVASKAGHDVGDTNEVDADRMQRGKDLEPALALMVQVQTRLFVVGEQTWCEHPDEPRHRATVDGFVAVSDEMPFDLQGPVEFKTHGVEVRPAWDYYNAQIQWQLHVTGFNTAVLAVAAVDDMTGDIERVTVERVHADPLAQASLVALADMLDDHLAAGTLPDPAGDDATTAAVKAVTWTTSPDTALAVDLTDMEQDVARYGAVKEAVAAAKTQLATIENRIRDRVGLASHGVAGEWRVTYSKPRRVLNEERVLDDHPELAKTVLDRGAAAEALGKGLDDYREPLGARTLTVRRTKDETP